MFIGIADVLPLLRVIRTLSEQIKNHLKCSILGVEQQTDLTEQEWGLFRPFPNGIQPPHVVDQDDTHTVWDPIFEL